MHAQTTGLYEYSWVQGTRVSRHPVRCRLRRPVRIRARIGGRAGGAGEETGLLLVGRNFLANGGGICYDSSTGEALGVKRDKTGTRHDKGHTRRLEGCTSLARMSPARSDSVCVVSVTDY